jgi:hypothetical protein
MAGREYGGLVRKYTRMWDLQQLFVPLSPLIGFRTRVAPLLCNIRRLPPYIRNSRNYLPVLLNF